MKTVNNQWRHFIDEGKYFVPEREAQLATICAAIPPLAGAGHIVELCSGEGILTRALLERFAEARLHAFDGSPKMLEATRRTAGGLAARLETRQFDLAARDLYGIDGVTRKTIGPLNEAFCAARAEGDHETEDQSVERSGTHVFYAPDVCNRIMTDHRL